MQCSPNVMGPPLASITAPGCTMHPSPKFTYPYKSAVSTITTGGGLVEERIDDDDIDEEAEVIEGRFWGLAPPAFVGVGATGF